MSLQQCFYSNTGSSPDAYIGFSCHNSNAPLEHFLFHDGAVSNREERIPYENMNNNE